MDGRIIYDSIVVGFQIGVFLCMGIVMMLAGTQREKYTRRRSSPMKGIHAPYETSRQGYYNIPNFWKDGMRLNFGIGYPF